MPFDPSSLLPGVLVGQALQALIDEANAHDIPLPSLLLPGAVPALVAQAGIDTAKAAVDVAAAELAAKVDDAKAQVRAEAAKGATGSVAPLLLVGGAIVTWLALRRRRGGRA